jgi:CheY-like chemotaxis protein
MSDKTKPSILVINDNVAICTGLVELLELYGFSARSSFAGADGLHQAMLHRPDAVLLDMNMPEMNGWEVCTAIRSCEDIANTAIVFHSGVRKPDDLAGADSFLTYPVPLDILSAVLHATIEKRRLLKAKQAMVTRFMEEAPAP